MVAVTKTGRPTNQLSIFASFLGNEHGDLEHSNVIIDINAINQIKPTPSLDRTAAVIPSRCCV